MRDILINLGLGVGGLVVVPMLSSALYRVLIILGNKLHIDFTAAQETQLRSLTHDAILAAEEYAAAKIKAGQEKPSSDTKLSVAVEHLQSNLPTTTSKAAIDMIKAALPSMGLGAAKTFAVLLCLLLTPVTVFAQSNPHTDIVVSVKQSLQERRIDVSGACGAYAITKRVAYRLQAEGAGVLLKPSGNNCEGYSTDSIVYPDGKLFDILIDAGGANGPAWQPNGIVDPSRRVVIAVNPDVIVSAPAPIENGDIEARLVAMDIMLHEIQGQQAVLLDTLLKLRQAAIDQGKAIITVIKSKK